MAAQDPMPSAEIAQLFQLTPDHISECQAIICISFLTWRATTRHPLYPPGSRPGGLHLQYFWLHLAFTYLWTRQQQRLNQKQMCR